MAENTHRCYPNIQLTNRGKKTLFLRKFSYFQEAFLEASWSNIGNFPVIFLKLWSFQQIVKNFKGFIIKLWQSLWHQLFKSIGINPKNNLNEKSYTAAYFIRNQYLYLKCASCLALVQAQKKFLKGKTQTNFISNINIIQAISQSPHWTNSKYWNSKKIVNCVISEPPEYTWL